MAGATEDPALLRDERKEMAGSDEVARHAVGIEDRRNRLGSLGGSDAGFRGAVVYGHGEGGAERRGVCGHHHWQVEPFGHIWQDRHANLTASLPDHEVDHLGRRSVGGTDEVALVLAVFVVGDDHGLATGNRGDGGLDGGEAAGHAAEPMAGVGGDDPL